MIDVVEALAVTVGAVILLARDRRRDLPPVDRAPLPDAVRIIPPAPYDWQREEDRTRTKGTPSGRSSR